MMEEPAIPRPKGARKGVSRKKTESAPPAVIHGYFRGVDGTRLFYSIEGKGKPLIFCYGLVCSSLHWTYQIQRMRHSHQAIWFDYRGHQNSESPEDLGSLTLETIAGDLRVLMDELDIKDAVILGHSMGVNVVLEFYKQNPDRVAGMILANGTPQRPLETFMRGNFMEPGFKLLRKVYDLSPTLLKLVWKHQDKNPLARTFVSMGGFNPHLTPREDIEHYVRSVAAMDPGIFLHLVASYERADATPWLHTVKAPTLILAGENDLLTPPETQELMRQLIPGSRLEVIRHGSHCSQMDMPDLVNHKIEDFLKSIEY